MLKFSLLVTHTQWSSEKQLDSYLTLDQNVVRPAFELYREGVEAFERWFFHKDYDMKLSEAKSTLVQHHFDAMFALVIAIFLLV